MTTTATPPAQKPAEGEKKKRVVNRGPKAGYVRFDKFDLTDQQAKPIVEAAEKDHRSPTDFLKVLGIKYGKGLLIEKPAS